MQIRFVQELSKREIKDERLWLSMSIVLGAICAWAGRYSMISDGISYLDLGDAYLRGDWAHVANGHWSPMYPWLLGIAMRIFRPSLWWEFPLVHAVNFVAFVWALFCFRFFLNSILLQNRREHATFGSEAYSPIPERMLRAMAYALFLWSSLVLIGLWLVTPDMLLSGWIYLTSGLLIQLRSDNSPWKFLALGAVLGGGYLCKAVMFPLAFVVLSLALFSGNSIRPRLSRVLLATATFLLVCSPLIVLLSRAKGRFTVGDSAKNTYTWFVSPGTPQINPESGVQGTLLHPTRKILEHPTVYEFSQPAGGSFPPWFDPSYWNEGGRPLFKWSSQLRTLFASMVTYSKFLLGQSGWLTGTLIFIFLGRKEALRGIARNSPVIGFCLLGLGSYALILALPRFSGAFLAVLGVSVLAGIHLPNNESNSFTSYVALAMLAVMSFSIAVPLLEMSYEGLASGAPWLQTQPMRTTEGLQRLGLRRGDRVAIIGIGISEFWARLGGFKIVAQIMPGGRGEKEFWEASPQQKNVVYKALESAGARALVVSNSSRESLGPGWQKLPDTYYQVYLLPNPADQTSP